MRNLLFLFVGLAAVFAGPCRAGTAPVVVELFTSQGCSSCPPADAFLTDLARQRSDVLVLAFHVTYWDSLGWKDPYSLPVATDRQNAYAQSLGTGEVYTPQMVVDGAHGFIGSRRGEGLEAIARAGAVVSHVPVSVVRDGGDVTVAVGAGTGPARVLLVGFDPEHQTHVGRGENGGRSLLESNIVRSLVVAGTWSGAPMTMRQPVPEGEKVAVLLQSENGQIIGAAR